jgi:phosphohistidine phosphatase
MKTLLIMRHGKSSWDDPKLADRERPLTKRGVKSSLTIGELVAEKELVPQRIISSTAVRAIETANLVSQKCGCESTLVGADELYLAEPDAYLSLLRGLPDELERVMVVGHNPGLEMLLQMLSGEIETLATAVLAHVVLPIESWKELKSDTEGHLVEIWRPKELAAAQEEKESPKKHKHAKKGEGEKEGKKHKKK